MSENHSKKHVKSVKYNPAENNKKQEKQNIVIVDPAFNFFYGKHFSLLHKRK